MAGLILQPRQCRDALRIAVIGRLDRHTADQFTTCVSALTHDLAATTTSVVVDLRCCTALDADGAAALAGAVGAAARDGLTLHVEDVPPLIEDTLGARAGGGSGEGGIG